MPSASRLTLDLAIVDVLLDVLGTPSINLAAGAEGRAKNLQDGALEVLSHRLEAHGAGNGNDLVERNGLGVLDVLLLLAVARRLLERLDDE